MSDGVVTMPFVVQLRVCDANLKADTAGRNPVWFQRRRIQPPACRGRRSRGGCERGGRGRRARVAMALRQCDARFKCVFAMQVRRQTPPCATHRLISRRAAERNSSVLWGVGCGRPRASLSRRTGAREPNFGEIVRRSIYAASGRQTFRFHAFSGDTEMLEFRFRYTAGPWPWVRYCLPWCSHVAVRRYHHIQKKKD